MSQQEIEDAAVAMIEQRGRAAMERAKQEILNTTYDNNGPIDLALKHYTKANLPMVMPLFPALVSLSYEAATGNPKISEIESVAVAMALIAFSADIHDDIIDKSTTKYTKKTIYGKFGSDIALLAGDALLIQGHVVLHKACETLSPKQRFTISSTLPKALFELSSAETLAIQLRKKTRINPDEYLKIMYLRGVFAELQCRIGGIVGQADDEMLETLACYGRTVGMFGTIKDEFNDLMNASELEHRIKFEYLPLPMLYAFQDKKVKSAITLLCEQSEYSNKLTEKIASIVLASMGVYNLKHKLNEQLAQKLKTLESMKKTRVEHDAFLLLKILSPHI